MKYSNKTLLLFLLINTFVSINADELKEVADYKSLVAVLKNKIGDFMRRNIESSQEIIDATYGLKLSVDEAYPLVKIFSNMALNREEYCIQEIIFFIISSSTYVRETCYFLSRLPKCTSSDESIKLFGMSRLIYLEDMVNKALQSTEQMTEKLNEARSKIIDTFTNSTMDLKKFILQVEDKLRINKAPEPTVKIFINKLKSYEQFFEEKKIDLIKSFDDLDNAFFELKNALIIKQKIVDHSKLNLKQETLTKELGKEICDNLEKVATETNHLIVSQSD